MAKVKEEDKIEFDSGSVYVLWSVDDEEGYGVEVLGEEGPGGDLVTMGDWTFGYGQEEYTISSQWASYITEEMNKLPKNSDGMLPAHIENVYCLYMPGQPGHLKNLKEIKEMINYDKV